MGSFGEKLKREREMRAITLEEISEATKIGTRSLKALEEEHFDQLPGGIFNKGFVRAYAKFLGIDEEQAVADYVAATEEVGTSTATQMQALADEAERQRKAKEAAQEANSGSTGALLALLIVIVVICGIAFGGYKAWKFKKAQREMVEAVTAAPRKEAPPPVTLPAAQTESPATNPDASIVTPPTGTAAQGQTSAAAAAPTTNAAPSTAQPATPAKTSETTGAAKPTFPLMVTIKAVQPSWIQAKSDGKLIFSGQMSPDDTAHSQLSLHANEKVSLVIGNAAGVNLTVNGKDAGSLGGAGKTRTLEITQQGIQQ